jgi:PTS system glucose-specific IIA component
VTDASGTAAAPPFGAAEPLTVGAPVAGLVLPLRDVPDPVFAAGLVGPGMAVDPLRTRQLAVAPVAGRLVKLKPHAFVVAGDDGCAVLVHLGIDTVSLDGDGFEPRAAEGQLVRAGAPVVGWQPARIEAAGMYPLCLVIALDAPHAAILPRGDGTVRHGDGLFEWRAVDRPGRLETDRVRGGAPGTGMERTDGPAGSDRGRR